MISQTASTVYLSNPEAYGPAFVSDLLYPTGWEQQTYISNGDWYPWIQLEWMCSILVSRIMVYNRPGGAGERFKNIYIHVGDNEMVADGLSTSPTNGLCAFFPGPSLTYGIEDIACSEPLRGRFLTIQLLEWDYLQIAEIIVFQDWPQSMFESINVHKLK